MLPSIDWAVLSRQIALISVPLLTAKGWLPAAMQSTATDLIAGLILVIVVAIGQKREKIERRIATLADAPEIEKIRVYDRDLAERIGNAKVIA